MSDFQGQIEEGRGKLKELLLKIPGFKGYIKMEDRRTADQLVRDVVADRFQEQLDHLTGVMTEFVDRGDLEYMDKLEGVAVKIRTFIDKIRHAVYGYSGFFDAIRIDESKLERLYAYDQALLDGIDQIGETLEDLASAVDSDKIKTLIASLLDQAQDMVKRADQRTEEITREDSSGGDEVLPSAS
jgi:methyl-accepting chemotaxis protein